MQSVQLQLSILISIKKRLTCIKPPSTYNKNQKACFELLAKLILHHQIKTNQ